MIYEKFTFHGDSARPHIKLVPGLLEQVLVKIPAGYANFADQGSGLAWKAGVLRP